MSTILTQKEDKDMRLNPIIAIFYAISVFFAVTSRQPEILSPALVSGAESAVELCLSLCGMICLWSALLELMRECGLTEKLSKFLRPMLRLLYPSAAKNEEVMDALATNVSANLLGLGNAATPAGINAALGLKRLSGSDSASNELCMLVVMNTASIQLLPTTVSALRASLGAGAPMDILPAVWLSSLVSLAAGILAAKFFERMSAK